MGRAMVLTAPPLRAAFQLVQQEIWGLCLLSWHSQKVVSVAERHWGCCQEALLELRLCDSRFKISSAHSNGEHLILASALMPELHVHPTLLP